MRAVAWGLKTAPTHFRIWFPQLPRYLKFTSALSAWTVLAAHAVTSSRCTPNSTIFHFPQHLTPFCNHAHVDWDRLLPTISGQRRGRSKCAIRIFTEVHVLDVKSSFVDIFTGAGKFNLRWCVCGEIRCMKRQHPLSHSLSRESRMPWDELGSGRAEGTSPR